MSTALDDAIVWAEKYPELHNQRVWRCGTGMCIAGILCSLDADTKFHSGAGDTGSIILEDGWFTRNEVVQVGERNLSIPSRATEILGIDNAEDLFEHNNELEDIRRIGAELGLLAEEVEEIPEPSRELVLVP